MSGQFLLPERWVDEPIPVTLVGVGGTGSEMLDGLVRLHMALVKLEHPGLDVTVYDPDQVSSANIGRQRFYPGDEGQFKALIAVNRINLFNGLDWQAYPQRFSSDSDTSSFLQYSSRKTLLVSCVDSAAARADIGKHLGEHGEYLWLDTGNDERSGQVIMGTIGRFWKQKLPHVYDLYPELDGQSDDDTPSCSFEEAIASQDLMINRVVADAATDLIWTLVRKGVIETHGAFVEASPMRVQPLAIDEMVWASLGWQPSSKETQAA